MSPADKSDDLLAVIRVLAVVNGAQAQELQAGGVRVGAAHAGRASSKRAARIRSLRVGGRGGRRQRKEVCRAARDGEAARLLELGRGRRRRHCE